MSRLPTSGADSGAWGTILNDYLTVEHTSDGTLKRVPATADSALYISGAGNDTQDGLTPGSPKRTLANAYTALPAGGGTIYMAPGRYDVGTGLNIDRDKPVWLCGTVKPPPHVPSVWIAPLTVKAAIIYSSTTAASLIQMTAGAATSRSLGNRFTDILFEMSSPSTTVAIDADSALYGEVFGCYFFADKSAGRSPITAQAMFVRGSASYGDNDCSWWRVMNNRVQGMSLGTFGNPTGTKYNCNQQVIFGNVGLGLDNTNTGCLPFLSFYGANRCFISGNNIESYDIGIRMDGCWGMREEGDGGEYVKYFLDLYTCAGVIASPAGISWGGDGSTTPYVAGAMLVRGDSGAMYNVFLLPTMPTGATRRIYPATDDPTNPAVSVHADNLILTSRHVTNQGVREFVGTGAPTAVSGSVGDRYWRRDGGSATTFYVKESGTNTTTGWVGK